MAMEATEYAFPFDAEPCEGGFDREYIADDFARYFRAFITSGIIADGGNIAESLQMVANDDMTTTLKKGNLMIDGYRYELMEDMIFHHTAADGVLDRIDRISITLDAAEREIHAIVREGEYSYKPVAPQCRRNSEHLDYVVADVRVVAGSIKIVQANITDTRLSTELCGIAFPFWELDTQPFFAQLNSFYNEFVAKSDHSYQQFRGWQQDKKEEVEAWQAEEEKQTDDWQQKETDNFTAWVEDFINRWESWLLGETKGWQEEIIDWFNNLREQLTENAAVRLQEQIGNLNNLATEEKSDLVSAVNSLALTYDETMAILAGVKTVTLTLSANDGASVEGLTVTLHNVATGEDTVMVYSGDGISFEVIGETEYILTVESMELHTTPEPLEITLTDEESLELNLEYRIMSLKDLSWAEINSVSESGKAGEVFNLHDTKEIELTTGEKVVLEIVGFDHDMLASDVTKKAGITFGTKNSLTQYCKMNPTDEVRAGGWKTSEMRTVYIKERFYNVLPEDLKAVIKQVNKNSFSNDYTAINNKQVNDVVETVDDVWLFSMTELGVKHEIRGTQSSFVLDEREGAQYQAFADSDQVVNARKKSRGTSEEAASYFTRSIHPVDRMGASDIAYNYVFTDGSTYAGLQYEEKGMVVGLCI